MMWFRILSALGLVTSVFATPIIAPVAQKFTSHIITDGSLRYVNDSGVCETTPGVHTMSGYIDITKSESMWFWFFAARKDPSTAPLVLWLNGGPGCSSMIGIFQENGPCKVNSDNRTTTLNSYSWNQVANVIYIDQPIGTGFSYGKDNTTTTQQAAVVIWKALQLLFESGEFSAYQSRELILATESYGGHYGPAFVSYFEHQNSLISKGKLKGERIAVGALMINNGWFDPALQYKAYIDYANNAPSYGPLVNTSTIKSAYTSYYKHGGCLSKIKACYAASPANVSSKSSDKVCKNADDYCVQHVQNACIGNQDSYDIRQQNPDPYPPEFYVDYLQQPSIQKAIGAEVKYQECPDAPFNKFTQTGDDARTWLTQLSTLANSKLKILLWAGDADYECNWLGVHAVVKAMNWYGKKRLASTPMTNMTVNGVNVASIQNVDNFSFARVYGAGHEVPYYQPAAALAILKQVIAKQPLHSV